MKITQPGFYASKAGKCEVVAVRDGYAIGWDSGSTGNPRQAWACSDGRAEIGVGRENDITAPWPPRKPVEIYAVHTDAWVHPMVFFCKEDAEREKGDLGIHYHARLIRLIEAPE